MNICLSIDQLVCKHCINCYTKNQQYYCHAVSDQSEWKTVEDDSFCGEGQWMCEIPVNIIEMCDRSDAIQVFSRLEQIENGLVPIFDPQGIAGTDEDNSDTPEDFRLFDINTKLDSLTNLLVSVSEQIDNLKK